MISVCVHAHKFSIATISCLFSGYISDMSVVLLLLWSFIGARVFLIRFGIALLFFLLQYAGLNGEYQKIKLILSDYYLQVLTQKLLLIV